MLNAAIPDEDGDTAPAPKLELSISHSRINTDQFWLRISLDSLMQALNLATRGNCREPVIGALP